MKLVKHMIGYLPALIIPAITSLLAITVFTHLLTTSEYGQYTLVISGMMFLNTVCFYWLQAALPRLIPTAIRAGNADALRATTYAIFAAISATIVLLTLIANAVMEHRWLLWFAVGLGIARSLLNVNLAWHRNAFDFKRYNIVECGQAILGLGSGIAIVWLFHAGALGALVGVLLGMGSMVLIDRSQITQASLAAYSPSMVREMLHFSIPLMFSYGLAFLMTNADRFMINYFNGMEAVGIYVAGYAIIDRIGQMLFMAIALPSFSLTIQKLEQEGFAAARQQTYHVGVAVLALAMPACMGLMLTAPQIAAVFIGPEFRDGAITVMPWIALSTFFNGLATHYFDHAFHFAKKTHMLLWTQGSGATLNLLLNVLLIPDYGSIGAAIATLASYSLLLLLSIILGRRAFPMHFPVVPALQIAMATACMGGAIWLVSLPPTLMGLIATVAIGTAVYSTAFLSFNIFNARAILLRLVREHVLAKRDA